MTDQTMSDYWGEDEDDDRGQARGQPGRRERPGVRVRRQYPTRHFATAGSTPVSAATPPGADPAEFHRICEDPLKVSEFERTVENAGYRSDMSAWLAGAGSKPGDLA